MRVFGLLFLVIGLCLCWLFIGPQANASDPQPTAPPVRPRDGGTRVDMTNARAPQPLQ